MAEEKEPGKGAIDSYEAEYMKGGGKILRREKTVWKLHWILLFPVPLCLFILAMILSGAGSKPAPPELALLPAAMVGLFSVLWLMFRVLRVHVTDQIVHIQYGIFGPQIPVAAITSCRVVDYDLTRYGGWGIRYGLDGSWAYSLAGDAAQVVEITWSEGEKSKKVVVSSLNPAALAASILSAKARATPKLRAPGQSASDEGLAAQSDEDELLLEEAQRQETTGRKR